MLHRSHSLGCAAVQLLIESFWREQVNLECSTGASFVVTVPKEDQFPLKLFARINGGEEAEKSIKV